MGRQAVLGLLAAGFAGGCSEMGRINDGIMDALFPVTEQTVKEDLDAKHAPRILVVKPKKAAVGKEVTIEVQGSHLTAYQDRGPGHVWLSRVEKGAENGQPERIKGRIDFHVRNKLRCVFDLSAATPGDWNVHVRRADDQQAIARNALRIVAKSEHDGEPWND